MNPHFSLLDVIDGEVFFLDGAMGTSIQELDLGPADFDGKTGCNEYLNLCNPGIIENIHAGFIQVGCMGLETNTMGASGFKLREYGLEDRVELINIRAVEIARAAAARCRMNVQVFGSIGPTGMLPSSNDPDLGNITFDQLAKVFEEQAAALLKGGADGLLIETSQDILEAKAAVAGCRRAARACGKEAPIISQISLDPSGRMLMGTDVGSALVTLEGMSVDVFGINCSTGPDEMRDSIRFLSSHSTVPISCLPNMGIPQNIDGRPFYPLEPEAFASAMEEFIGKFGINIAGGCCGSTTAHLRALIEKTRSIIVPSRNPSALRAVSSAMTYVPLEQSPAPLLVGERINAQGSRKMKQMLLADDLTGIGNLARGQAEKGAHALDVCVALNEVEGETERFLRIAKELALRVGTPIMIDSTDNEVINAAVRNYPGRVIINSINLENGEKKIDELGKVIKDYGSYVIALTIDENGMAQDSARKTAVAERIAGILLKNFSIKADRLIFDPLTFTLATGEEQYRSSAVETLDALKNIKRALPGSMTILGISNVSFGLSKAARAVLNSAFLYHAIRNGLDLAIVNPADIIPYSELSHEERNLADNLLFNKNESALADYIKHYEGATLQKHEQKKEFVSPEEEVHYKILNRRPENIEKLLDIILEEKDAVAVLNNLLLPAMKDVGDKFGSGELILPFVLQSAEVMKTAVKHLEQFLEKKDGYSKGIIVLATVYGDVHDIGKNLVRTILSNNGYEVHDLGKQVPVHEIIDAVEKYKADAVGLSALLVSTSKQMPIAAEEMFRAGIEVPIIAGGAAVTRQFTGRSSILENGETYPHGFFYAKDAFEGLRIVDEFMNPDSRKDMLADYKKTAEILSQRAMPSRGPGSRASTAKPAVIEKAAPPSPPFWGIKIVNNIDIEKAYDCMDLNSLFRLSWGIRRMEKKDYKRILRDEFEPLRLELQKEAKEKQYLRPMAVYGYFPCKSNGDSLLIFDPANKEKLLTQMVFPRQKAKKLLSIPDYFRRDVFDVLPLQLVTVGNKTGEICEALNEAGEYSRSYFLHGLSVESTEGLAEYIHRKIKNELGLESGRGKRYSHGYPACPNLEDNKTILELLDNGRILGVELTSAFQFVPEQTTAAFIAHHPQAEYFSV